MSLNEEQSLWNLRSALTCLILENVIPKDGQSLNELDARNGLMILARKKVCRFCQNEGSVTPRDGQSLCEEKMILIPKDDLNGRPAYARLWNLNRVIRFDLRRKDGLTSSCALGDRFCPGRSEACLTTLCAEFCHLMI